VWKALLEFLGIRRREEPKPRDALETMGIFIVKDERLEERLRLLEEFYKTRDEIVALKARAETGELAPEEALEKLIDDMNATVKLIDKIATPWWRALDRGVRATIMRAWGDINGYFFDVAHTLLNWFKRAHLIESVRKSTTTIGAFKPRLPKGVLVGSFLTLVIREWLPRAEALVRTSWAGEDVAPSWTSVIQPTIRLPESGAPTRAISEEELRRRGGA